MAIFIGKPSEYIKANLLKNIIFYSIFLFAAILGLLACIWFAYQVFGTDHSFIIFVLYLIALFFLTKAMTIVFNLDNFRLGGLGEKRVEDELAKLPDTYIVFRSVHVNGKKWDTDFIVLGPKGLITIEVKSHRGQISFDGQQLTRDGKLFEKDILAQARGEVIELLHWLETKYGFKGYINSVIVFSNFRAKMSFGLKPINHTYVIGKGFLIKLIYSLPDVSYNISNLVLKEILTKSVQI